MSLDPDLGAWYHARTGGDPQQPGYPVGFQPPPVPMRDEVLMAYARGWLDGYERAYADGHVDGMDASAEHWTECVRRANRISERAGARKEWDQAVRRGERPRTSGPESGRDVDHVQ